MTRKVNVVFGPEYIPGLPCAVIETDGGVTKVNKNSYFVISSLILDDLLVLFAYFLPIKHQHFNVERSLNIQRLRHLD